MFKPVFEDPGTHPASYYAATAGPNPVRLALSGDIRADVCVVGAGLTGLGAALHLAGNGVKVVVLEAARVGWGASGRNGGQANTGMRKAQNELEHQFGREVATQFWDLSMSARRHLDEIVGRNKIQCDLKPGLFRVVHSPSEISGNAEYAAFLRSRYGYAEMEVFGSDALRRVLGTEAYVGGTYDRGSAHLHPLKLVLGMAKAIEAAGGIIHEQSAVVGIEKRDRQAIVRTLAGSVTADQIILAGDVLMRGVDADLEARVMPINGFVLATEPLSRERAKSLIANDAAVVDSKFLVNYFRLTADYRLLFGGGETYSYRIPRDLKHFVRRYMLRIFPQLEDVGIDYAWSGAIGITRSRLPYVRRLDGHSLAAAGYSGKGVLLAPYFGKVLAEAAMGQSSELELLSRLPSTGFPGGSFLRFPLLVAGMSFYALRDRLGL